MAERAQRKKANPERVKDEAQVETKVEPKGEKLIAEMDDLLDEIDEVLESNAEDFVKSYVQKG
ncbi:MAG: ubiquitin-like protein Pup, partial [Actinomycetota bacterium]